MKALVLEKTRSFIFKDVPAPHPAEDEVLIRVKACAVCGSDVHGMDGSTGRRRPPIIMGHEAAGVIEQCGSGVKNYQVGERVTFDSTIYCGKCAMCQSGNVNLCADRRVLGVSCAEYSRDGAFCEYICVPERILYRLPENVSFLDAAMVEPLAVAYHAITRTTFRSGSSALVVGVGTIGLLLVQVLRSLGASPLIAVDIDENRLTLAAQNGATDCIHATDTKAIDTIIAMTSGGVQFAFDATGITDTANFCIESCALNGNVVLIGNLQANIQIPLQRIVTRQISIFGSCASAGEYNECLDLIASRKVQVQPMISKAVPLSEGAEWIQKVYNREDGLTKIILLP